MNFFSIWQINWTRRPHVSRSDPDRIIVMNSKLNIPDVTLKDNGIYNCTATLNGVKKHASVKVIVHGEYAMDRFLYY